MPLPRLTHAQAPLTQAIEVLDEHGERRSTSIPAERPLTVFVDKRELLTLMTLGAAPELLVLGYLRNQRLLERLDDIESITVDWDVNAAAVRTVSGLPDLAARTAQKVVTTGCGQGTVFGGLMDEIDRIALPPPAEARISQRGLYALLEAMRLQESTYKSSGSVHGCALFALGRDTQGVQGAELMHFVEDVGRHNAIDTIAGWMWMQGLDSRGKVFYTTGRLTSEMVIKAAQMGVPIVVSRSGVTQMGHALAQQLGMTLFGRAINRHFLCYSGFERFDAEPAAALERRPLPGD